VKLYLPYYGSKVQMLDDLYMQFPPHTTFVDVFGGGGSVIFSKSLSDVNIYNDIGEVANFYQVLRDTPEELIYKIEMTPFSRGEYETAAALDSDNPVERAWAFFVLLTQGFMRAEEVMRSGWRLRKTFNSTDSYNAHVAMLYGIAQKIRQNIVIESLPFQELIKRYDGENTLFYCDPPYELSTRKGIKAYVHEFTEADSRELLTMLNECQGQVVLSGYENDLYNGYLQDWRLVRVNRVMVLRTGRKTRVECIWVKEHRRSLWEGMAI
jgi:DNA adenine methylase